MNRRAFFTEASKALLIGVESCVPSIVAGASSATLPAEHSRRERADITLFLCGDVMTGRGIDQILPHPSKPHLYERYVRSALRYVEIAEEVSGPIKRPVDFSYIWGDALVELDRVRPQARIINLETAVTTAEDAWPGKGIHYRMHPANVPCIAAANIDCCSLANNHVLDWGYRGLTETVDTLHQAGIRTAGAGHDEAQAAAPAVIELAAGRRVLVFALGMDDAGVPASWAATTTRAGVSFLSDLSPRSTDETARRIGAARRSGDVVVVSIHWGSNWGYGINNAQRTFARRLVDTGTVDVVHGHSSHHPKGIEVYRDRLILYGCGDFMNDYEGIRGHQEYRPDLTLMYFPTFDAGTGKLARFVLVPMRIRNFRLNRVHDADIRWLQEMLIREGRALGTRVERERGSGLVLRWNVSS